MFKYDVWGKPIEEVMFEHRLEGGKEVSREGIWGSEF